MVDESLERLLDLDGWWWWLENGWSVRYRIRLAEVTEGRPYGIRYSFTLNDEAGERILGYDNAVRIPRRVTYDHRHPLRNVKKHIPYEYVDADRLLEDFLKSIEIACKTENVVYDFVEMERRDDNAEVTD